MKKASVRALAEFRLLQTALKDALIGPSSVGESWSQLSMEANIQNSSDSEIPA